MRTQLAKPWPLGSVLGRGRPLLAEPGIGFGAVQGAPPLMQPVEQRPNVSTEEEDDPGAAAAARRAKLAQALMERAKASYEGASNTGAWNALPGIAEAISQLIWDSQAEI